MKASEIRVGGVYLMKVSGTVQRVRVDAITERETYRTSSIGRRTGFRTIYECTNLATRRKCQARSPSKFRKEVKPAPGPWGPRPKRCGNEASWTTNWSNRKSYTARRGKSLMEIIDNIYDSLPQEHKDRAEQMYPEIKQTPNNTVSTPDFGG